MEKTFMNNEKSVMNDSHKFVLDLSRRLDLRSSNKHIPLHNLCIYYTWKNSIRTINLK